MTGSRLSAEALLREYRGEVLRWNRQVNLVSRKEPAKTFDRLMAQCRKGLEVLLAADPGGLSTARNREYFDLGSGGGLPGIVWHVLLKEYGMAAHTTLVEPREKRAWFLDRLRGLSGMPDFGVSATRWGGEEVDSGPGPGTVTLISLKALRLTDPEILTALSAPGDRIGLVIARYYPPGEPFTSKLARELEISVPGSADGQNVAIVGVPWVPAGAEFLPGTDFSLLVSRYEAASS